MKAGLRPIFFIISMASLTMLPALRALCGSSVPSEPLIDLDLGFLSTDLPANWQSDPFRKVAGFAQVKPADEKFTLGGIVYSDVEPEAVVNGESVYVGDEIGDRVVESIGRNYVILQKGDSLKELVLPPAEPQADSADDDAPGATNDAGKK